MDQPIDLPVSPMLAKPLQRLPDQPCAFEPKWDGYRCVVARDGDELHLGSRNGKDLLRYFPEMVEPLLATLPPRCVVDGELVVPVDGRLDFDALGQRIHPAESRVTMLAEATPASYVVFDLLALDDAALLDVPFERRREALEEVAAAGFAAPVHLAPATRDRDEALEWFERFEGAGLDGLIVKPLADLYVPGKRTQGKLKHVRTADCVVAGYRVHKDGRGVGSLLLGLNDDQGRLQHVGVAASFTAKRRAELVDELAPLELDEVSDHPWASWAEAEAHADGAMPGAPNRWSGSGDRDHRWVPLRPERVAEVRYTWATAGRFRGTTKMQRWRPDREPASCSTAQLAEPEHVPLAEVLAAGA